jgi:hypothetical protein
MPADYRFSYFIPIDTLAITPLLSFIDAIDIGQELIDYATLIFSLSFSHYFARLLIH